MNAYEKNLLNGIPQDEAASFFLRVTGRDKVAEAQLEEAWNELTPAEQDELLKEAEELGLLSSEETDKTAEKSEKKKGPLSHRVGEFVGRHEDTFSGIGGAASGVAAALAHGGSNKALRAGVGGVGGYLLGRAGGRFTQGVSSGMSHAHARSHEKHKEANMAAPMGMPPKPASMPAPTPISLPPTAQGQNSVKMAFDGAGDGGVTSGSTDPDGDPTLEEYLRQEAVGADQEQQMGADFYRQRLMAAQQELEQLRAQSEETTAQTEQLQQQVSQNDETIQASMQQAQMAQQSAMANVQQAHQMTMDATTQAMESQAEVLRQKQLAAAMRMGVQTLKDNVMNAMAQDPTDQLAQQLQAPPPGSGGMAVGGQPPPPPAPIDPMTGQPMVDPAMAGQDPNAAAGGAPAPAGGGGEGGGEKKPSSGGGEKKEKSESKSEKKDDKKDKDDDGGKTHVEVKTGSVQDRFLAAVRGVK